ncbi:hypothetical protein ACFO5K_18780 [Nocardia halotolerans]|uniref:PRC-barrel domain-containing protein n=1 Tax=Nocardia halotolerans TaxID=1755878 RepID=A0ABV8VJD2_9NOCA
MMRARDLIDARVWDADGRQGVVLDLRAIPVRKGDRTALVVEGLVVGRHRIRLLGYERREERGPALLRWLVGLLHRDTRYVELTRCTLDTDGTVRLRSTWDGYPTLREVRAPDRNTARGRPS